MAYIPTKEDFEEPIHNSEEYVPSLQDFEEKPISLGQRLKNIGSNVLRGTERLGQIPLNVGSAAAQHLLNIGEETANLPNLLSGGRIPKFGAHIEAPFYNPEAPESQLTEGGLQAGELLSGALPLAKLGLAGASKIPALAKLGERLGTTAAGQGKNIIRDLLQGSPVSEAHKPILSKLRQNYKTNLTNSNDEYGLVKKLANDRDYSGEDKLSKALGVKTGKSINASQTLDDIKNLDIKDNVLKNLIEKFDQKPSFDSAHKLQSRLGSEGYYLINSSDGSQISLGNKLLESRRNLVNDIQQSFVKNKDNDLGELYKKATSNYKENVVPYLKNGTINKVVTKRDLDQINPRNIHNVLSSDDEAVQKVVSELPQEERNLIFAKELFPSVKQTEKYGMKVDPDNLLNRLYKLRNNGFDKFLEPQHRNLIRELEDRLELERKYIEPGKKILKSGAKLGGAALLGGAGYKLGKEIF